MRCHAPQVTGVFAGLSLLGKWDAEQSIFDPAGPAAGTLAGLSWFVLLLFVGVTLVMWLLILWVALRRRGTFAEHAPYDAGGGQPWILIGGFLIPTFILAVVFVHGLRVMEAFPLHDGTPYKPEIRIIGRQWWWEIHYLGDAPYQRVVTANEIHIPTGQPVEFELESADVIHSFWIPKLHGKVDLVPGLRNHIRLQADQPGMYHGECAEFCGVQHAHMRLLLVAESPERFEQWLEQQRETGVIPTSPEAERGQVLFVSRACGLCHTIRGTEARGGVGPDLTHLASRHRIAANSLPNDTAHLTAWVIHAQSFKPGAQMPNVTQFTGEELRALVVYLQQLQ
ncbi:MAG TPA: cytochrome c oxidase subunit II [Candidatus Tectomicrobia bacterium]